MGVAGHTGDDEATVMPLNKDGKLDVEEAAFFGLEMRVRLSDSKRKSITTTCAYERGT